MKSSLEAMLEAIQQRDKKPKDLLPGLPSRPAIRGRLPSQKRSLPINFEVEETEEERAMKRYHEMVLRSSVFGRRIDELEQTEESPYVKVQDIVSYKGRWEYVDSFCLCTSALVDEKFRLSDIADTGVKKKLHVWCRRPDGRWLLGCIESIKGEDANILLADGRVLMVSFENLLPANPDILDDVDDLIQLGYINEPSVLHSLKCRYSHHMIYTKAGQVLLAINPFGKEPLYGSDFIAAYKEKASNRPHVCAVAESAFSKMMRERANQSIIISGESGSGKTETAKLAMQYLASLGGGTGMEHAMLLSNFILEAFGNAKTSINDNSSRFGKITDIHFHMDGKICGAKVQTFLLEKERIVWRAQGERSYHVFYQLCAGAPALLKEKLNVKAANEYEYLKQSDCLRIKDVDDVQRFHELTAAFNNVHISKENQENAFAILAAVLWLGNIEFLVIDNEDHVEVVPNEGVTSAAKLMGCKACELMQALSSRRIQSGNDAIIQKLTLLQAMDTRDALAKSMYNSLFDWLVEQINKSLEVRKSFTGNSINILDIYGFESLQKNNFEQFCINYANERLQQHFNRHLFKLEQEEYIKDGIDYITVDYKDNTDCIDLFEKKPLGLFFILDEASSSPEATDLTFEFKLKQCLNGNPCFNGERQGAFQVRHCTGEVLYDTHGFLEKSRDPLPSDCMQLLLSCDCQLLQSFAFHMLNRSQNPVSSSRQISIDSQRQSITTKFKCQVLNLMQHLENTTPHFILCIKPNSNKLPGGYEEDLVLQQLRCCGVLDVVRLLRSGYPARMTHLQFSERYGFLLLKNVSSEDALTVAVAVLMKFSILPEMYQVGYTKLFFRTGQIAALENIRNHTMRRILWLQKSVRGIQDWRSFQEIKKGTTIIQSFIRGSLARKNFITNAGPKTHHKTNRMPVQNLQVQALIPMNPEMRALKAETALKQKEEEIGILRRQLHEYATRCSDNEAKMKCMQESWHQSSLQMNASPTHNCYGSMSTETCTTEGKPPKHACISKGSTPNGVSHLVREFEQRIQAFENDARVLVEVKLDQSLSNANPKEDLRMLKVRFTSWKKDYMVQLKDAKKSIRKLRVSNGEKPRRKWWNCGVRVRV